MNFGIKVKKGVTFQAYIQIIKWKCNIKHMAMLDRYLTLSCQSFVPLRRLIFILFVKKCDLWPETARKPVIINLMAEVACFCQFQE
jgi:hypothetical protein